MQNVLITAGATGIGLAMAKSFLARGDQVAIVDVDKQAIKKLQSDLPDITCFEADVTNESQIQAVFDDLTTRWNSLDVVCANAGTAGPAGAIEDISLSDWKSCLAVNLDGTFLTAQGAAKQFKKQNSGLLIMTSSTAGLFGYPYRSPYATAKWGIIGLMKTLAMELGPFGVRANAICPGAVEGPRMEGVLEREAAAKGMTRDQVYKGYAAGTSMQAFVQAGDIADMAVFLGSEQARMVSGQVIAVDGHTENPDPKV